MKISYLFMFFFRGRQRQHQFFKKIEVKCWKKEVVIFEKRIKQLTKAIKYSKNVDIMVKNFDTIKEEFDNIMKYKPFWKDIEFNGISIKDTNLIYTIRDTYIKDFINEQIETELKKKELVDTKFLKEHMIRKAIFWALKGAIYFSNNAADYLLKINELEQELLNCYRGNKNENES